MKSLTEQIEAIQEHNPMMYAELKRLITNSYLIVEHSNNGMDLPVVIVGTEEISKAARGILGVCDCYSSMFDCGNCTKNCEECC